LAGWLLLAVGGGGGFSFALTPKAAYPEGAGFGLRSAPAKRRRVSSKRPAGRASKRPKRVARRPAAASSGAPPPAAAASTGAPPPADATIGYKFQHRPGHGTTSTIVIQSVKNSRDKSQILRVTAENVDGYGTTPQMACEKVVQLLTDKATQYAVTEPISKSTCLKAIRAEARSFFLVCFGRC